MSLDVSLRLDKPPEDRFIPMTEIYIRRNGSTECISRDEWDEMYPDSELVTLEDDYYPYVFSANITHNLNTMAREAGIYEALWRPEELAITTAKQLVPLLQAGLTLLKADRSHFEQLNPENGWGDYDGLVRFVTKYLAACIEYPDALVEADR